MLFLPLFMENFRFVTNHGRGSHLHNYHRTKNHYSSSLIFSSKFRLILNIHVKKDFLESNLINGVLGATLCAFHQTKYTLTEL